ncbi:hypothetical protein [Bacillus massiliigorillae]|uniref:hypothetical protein n=1 Tax=Bacillus massiliigorillae TaxID=1243664 RepID=UPI0003A59BEF|nr:hypothetical protein [Bacillus massiliigorillae]
MPSIGIADKTTLDSVKNDTTNIKTTTTNIKSDTTNILTKVNGMGDGYDPSFKMSAYASTAANDTSNAKEVLNVTGKCKIVGVVIGNPNGGSELRIKVASTAIETYDLGIGIHRTYIPINREGTNIIVSIRNSGSGTGQGSCGCTVLYKLL